MGHAIPLLPIVDILDAEIGSEVNDTSARIQQRLRFGHRYAIGGGKEHDITFFQSSHCRIREFDSHSATQAGKQVGNGHAGLLAGSYHRQFGFRVCGENPQKLHSGIASPSYNANFFHLHQ